jgi:hypothetical protein
LSDLNYRTLRFDEITVQRNRGEEVAKAIKTSGVEGSQTLGVFIPMIGVSANVVTTISNWTGEPKAAAYQDGKIVGVHTRLLDTLARGQEPCTADGIYTHRRFMCATEHVQILTDTSVEAWKTMEADSDARIAGFWLDRARNAKGEAVVLMIVYYPSLAIWDATRYWKPKPAEHAQPNRDTWGGLFAQRREILLDSFVTIHRLAK